MDEQTADRECSKDMGRETKAPWYLPTISEAEWAVLRRIRFSLKSLLAAMTVLVAVSWAYWFGREGGYKRGVIETDSKWQVIQQQAEKKYAEELFEARFHKLSVEYHENRKSLYLYTFPIVAKSLTVSRSDLDNACRGRSIRTIQSNCVRYENEAIRYLVSLPDLEEVILQSAELSDESISLLPKIKNLSVLNIINSQVTASQLRQFASCPNLTWIALTATRENEDAIAELQRDLPDLKVVK